jgi:dTDP-4-amino-4,6-dideoxygalactose transaminase
VAGPGIGPGDEVIVTALTFVASAMAVLHQNAVPVFVDIDPDTYLMDPKQIEDKINERTKAVMCVHLHGLPCPMDEINRIVQKHNLKVIEDVAQAYGALYQGKKAGSLGDAAGYSMCTTKHLMVGEGGLVTMDSEEVYRSAAMTRLFGENTDMREEARPYMSEMVGWNYKLAEPSSALARVKLRHLDEYIGATQRNAQRLTQRLQSIEGVVPPIVPPGRTHSTYLYPVQVDPDKLNLDIEPGKLKDAILKALKAENVSVGRLQQAPVPAQPLFQNKTGYGEGWPWNCHGREVSYDIYDYPNTTAAIEKSFFVRGLPPPHDLELMDLYAEAFEKVVQNIDRVVDLFDETEQYIPLGERMERWRKPS